MTEGDEYPSTDYFEMVWHTIWEEERTGRDNLCSGTHPPLSSPTDSPNSSLPYCIIGIIKILLAHHHGEGDEQTHFTPSLFIHNRLLD